MPAHPIPAHRQGTIWGRAEGRPAGACSAMARRSDRAAPRLARRTSPRRRGSDVVIAPSRTNDAHAITCGAPTPRAKRARRLALVAQTALGSTRMVPYSPLVIRTQVRVPRRRSIPGLNVRSSSTAGQQRWRGRGRAGYRVRCGRRRSRGLLMRPAPCASTAQRDDSDTRHGGEDEKHQRAGEQGAAAMRWASAAGRRTGGRGGERLW